MRRHFNELYRNCSLLRGPQKGDILKAMDSKFKVSDTFSGGSIAIDGSPLSY